MKYILPLLFCMGSAVLIHGQMYDDYIGAGHNTNVTVTTSSSEGLASGDKTVNADGMDAARFEASRFLAQATLGHTLTEIDNVLSIGFETWIDQQCNLAPNYASPMLDQVLAEVLALYVQNGGDPEEFFGPSWLHFNYTWWQLNMTANDLLRQRVALALSEIFVISINSDLDGHGEALASFYDLLLRNSFSNFHTMLLEVTLHPAMGYYLSHFNNPRSDPANNIHPDENYAREIMQLFSIGLYLLNQDGSRVLDGNGNFIPTYDNNDIKELAKVFTGLSAGALHPDVDWTDEPYFGIGIYGTDFTFPMAMYDEYHEPGPKTIVGGYTIPNGQTGMQDVQDAVMHLFNHQNVGPFFARRLIQRLVKSNPSPGYISRVAAAFNDNGNGVRGDMKAVIKAVLLDTEARDCAWMLHPDNGRLREPIVRYTNVAKGLPLDSPHGRYWNNGYSFMEATRQHPMWSPTVFNFFLPDFQPNGPILNNDLFAPEYQIHNSRTSIGYINQVNQWVVWGTLWWSWEEGDPNVTVNLSPLEPMAEDPEVLLNYLDIVFTHGTLSDETRATIRTAMNELIWGDYLHDRTRMALYLLLLSPDFTTMR